MFQNNLTELKSFGSPPLAVINVTAGVLVLQAKKGKVPKDRSWKACKVYYCYLLIINYSIRYFISVLLSLRSLLHNFTIIRCVI